MKRMVTIVSPAPTQLREPLSLSLELWEDDARLIAGTPIGTTVAVHRGKLKANGAVLVMRLGKLMTFQGADQPIPDLNAWWAERAAAAAVPAAAAEAAEPGEVV